MLEFCLPAGGFLCVPMSGALVALRERKAMPDIVTGVSAGAWAAYLAYIDDYQHLPLRCFMAARDYFASKSWTRFLPPYDNIDRPDIATLLQMSASDPDCIKALGIRHFYVGYTELPLLRFKTLDVLALDSRERIYQILLKSSVIPFITHFGWHHDRGLDGAIRRMAFCSHYKRNKKWLFTYWQNYWKLRGVDKDQYDRIIPIRGRIHNPLYATDEQLRSDFELGYELGMQLAI